MSKHLTFGLVCLTLMLSSVGGTSVSVAFPVLTVAFGSSLVVAGWVLTVFQLVSTAAMPLTGKLSDIVGNKAAFLVCLLLFTTGSALAALAPNIELLIAARIIQGAGAGGFLPVSAGITADSFPESRQKYIGFMTSIFPVGQIIGPNLGAWMVSAFGWQSVFWLNVPFGLVLLVLSVILLKPGKKTRSTIDIKGAGLFTGSLGALLTGITGFENGGAGPVASAILLAASVGLAIAFVRHVNRSRDPIVHPDTLKKKPFAAANIYNMVFGAGVLGVLSFIPLYAVSVYGMTIFESGLMLTPRSIAMVLGSTFTSLYITRLGYRRPMIVGGVLVITSLILLALEPGAGGGGFGNLSPVMVVTVIMFISGLGVGIIAPASNNACIELMPDHITSITGMRGMFRQTGGAISIAITSLLLSNLGDMSLGFAVSFFALAAVTLGALPLIFAMPESPRQAAIEVKTSPQAQ